MQRPSTNGSNLPVPDPSLLTTLQLEREILALRELLETQLGGQDKQGDLTRVIIETRLDGMDKAIKLSQDTADKFPERIDEKISFLRGVTDEKFNSIQTQFRERDVRTEQSSKDNKVAVDAALQAAKEMVGEQNKSGALAISKNEIATAKQIEQLGSLIATVTKAIDDKIGDMKERLTRIEGTKHGMQSSWGVLLGAVGLITGLIGIASAVLR